MKTNIILLPLAALAACASPRGSLPRDSETLYLRSADTALDHRPSRAAVPTPSIAPVAAHRAVRSPTIDDPLRTRQSQLLGRIQDLSNDEADAVCLGLELIPREQIFDHRLKPKTILLRYASQLTSPAQLDSIERAINNLSR